MGFPLGLWCALTACDPDGKKGALASVPRERSEAVVAVADTSPKAAPSPSPPSPTSAAARSATVRKLCEGELGKPGRELPKRPPSSKAATGGGARPTSAVSAAGKWTWINLWAAWCGPCKEEIPRLRRFATRLLQGGKEVNLTFLSLDDDERQLESFLAAQPEDGVRATLWLREGAERDEWLRGAGLSRDPGLPLQLLVDPRGKIRCTIQGAVEDRDYADLATILASP